MKPTLLRLVLGSALSVQPMLAIAPEAPADEAVAASVRIFQNTQLDAGARRAALARLSGFGDRARLALPQLILTLRGTSETVKVAGAEAVLRILLIGPGSGLSEAQAAAAVPTLGGALSDPREQVRTAAAALLAVLGERAAPAVEPLTAALADPNPAVRASACTALGGIGISARTALDRLHEVSMLDPKSSVRARATAATEKIRKTGPVPDAIDDSAVVGLEAKLSSPNPEERLAAIHSLMYLAVRVPRAMALRPTAGDRALPLSTPHGSRFA